MTKSNFEKLAKAPAFARPPRRGRGRKPDHRLWRGAGRGRALGAADRPHSAIRDGRVAGIQAVAEGEGRRMRQDRRPRCSTT